MPGAPPSAGTTMPESSASAGSPLASAAAFAFNAAFASKLVPVSSGSGIPSVPAETVSIANGANSAENSWTVQELRLAMTRRSPVNRRAIASAEAECGTLMPGELANTRPGKPQHLGEERLVKRGALGGRLDLDNPARTGQHEIRIGFGLRILGIVQVEHRRPGDDPTRDRGHAVVQWQIRQQLRRHQMLTGLVQRYIAAGHRGGAGATIRLQYVAINADLALAKPGQVDDGAQAAADQPLDLLGAAALPAARRLAVGTGRGRARQHAVFGGDPTPARIAQKWRHPFLERGGAQHMRVAELRQARALGIFCDPRIENDRSHHIGGAP